MTNIIVRTAINDKEIAEGIVRTLLDERLISCGQINEIESIYRWREEIVEDKGYLVSMSARLNDYKFIEKRIKDLHTYELPEISYFEINGSNEFLNWINSSTTKEINI